MKKRFKVLTTVAVSAAMIMSSVMPVLADNDGAATGSAEYEGYVEEISAFTVVVPTSASAAEFFNFTVDPNGLLAGTDYTRLLGGDANVTADNFDASADLYFKNTKKVGDVTTDPWFTNTSKKITCENQSSYAVDIEVTAAVSGADGLTIGEVDASSEDPTLYLAIKTSDEDTDKQTIAITDEGGKYESTIDGVEDNFMIKYNTTSEEYEYVVRTNTDTSKTYNKNGDEVSTGGTSGVALDDWETIDFYLEGDCGGTWTADQAALTVSVDLTWKVTDPEAAPTTYTVTYNANYTGADPATATETVAVGENPEGPETAFTREGYTFAGWATTSDGEAVELTTITDTDTLYALWTENSVAPSVEKTSYTKAEMVALIDGGVATIDVNYGSGSLGGTAITKVWFSSDGTSFKAFSDSNAPTIDNENNTFSLTSGWVNGLSAKRYVRAYFDNSEDKYVEIVINP